MSQREQLQAEIEDLQAKEQAIVEQIRNADRNTQEYAGLVSDINNVREKIKAKKAELEQLEAADAASITAIAAIDNEFASIEIEGLPIYSLFLTQAHFDIFMTWWKETEGKKAADQAVLEASYKSQIASLGERIVELEGGLNEAIQENAELSEALRQSKEEVADLDAKRHAAANELKDAKEEAERLAKDNESLRKQLEAKSYNVPTNANANLAEMVNKLKQSLPGIYNKRWKDETNKTAYLANLSATGEEIEIPWLEIGKYREESAEDALRFRQAEEERKAKEALELAAQSAENLEAPELSFQDETEDDTVQADTSNGEVDDAPVTRAEIRGIQARLLRLEEQAGLLNNVPVPDGEGKMYVA